MTYDDQPTRAEAEREAIEDWIEANPDACPACLGKGVVNVVRDEFGWTGDTCEVCDGLGNRQPTILALTARELLLEHGVSLLDGYGDQ
ncbi:MAG: hypothetical protein V4472_25580 [Pseudomonadota bacterium]